MLQEFIAKKIVEARKTAGLTQQALADILGVAKDTIYRWEKSNRMVDFNSLEQIAEATGIDDPFWFFTPDDSPSTPGIPVTPPETPVISDSQQQILENTNRLLAGMDKVIKQTALSQTVNQLNNSNHNNNHFGNLIPFPGKNRPRNFSFIAQPVGAGKTFADCEVQGRFSMELPYDADYAFRVSGMSMAPDIVDGDLIFVKATKQWKERDIVIAYIKDTEEWTIKQIYYGRKNNEIALRGTWDSEYYLERDIIIQGIFRYSIRDKEIINEIMEKMEEANEK